MDHRAYAQRSFTRIAERAAEELESADPRATSLWRDISSLVEAMRTGQSAWGVPAYNGALFAPDGFDGAAMLEVAAAAARGQTLSEFVRQAARREAEQVLAKRTSIVLDSEEAARFLAALEDPGSFESGLSALTEHPSVIGD
jgi:uncharacterized protein (DUF1778 family)